MARTTPVFHKAHHNIIAAQIKERLAIATNFYNPDMKSLADKKRDGSYYAVDALVHLALSMARRFKQDNELFNPVVFLDACSPDPDTMPLSELWED